MLDVILDTLMDVVKILPFLLIAFIIIELIEHKLNKKNKKILTESQKFGPLLGGILGIIPQCGFSVMATNLYVTRIITLGTLISVYLSTSDEMLPILLSEKADINIIVKILAVKLLIGVICGFIIDVIINKKQETKEKKFDLCENEHCHCEKGIIHSSLIHTFKTAMFILITTFILNTLMFYIGNETLSKIFLKDNIFGPFLTSLIGLIPNCGASIVLTELYINGAISFSSVIAGLLTGSGIALIVLFKSNKDIKENFKILSLVYFIGVISGIIIEIFSKVVGG